MKSRLFPKSAHRALIVAFAVLAPFAAAQLNAAPAAPKTGGDEATVRDSASIESGTIPAARPGLPQISRGAEGPIRTDRQARSNDPSLRDSNPLTVNGLWETLPGNVVARPHPQ